MGQEYRVSQLRPRTLESLKCLSTGVFDFDISFSSHENNIICQPHYNSQPFLVPAFTYNDMKKIIEATIEDCKRNYRTEKNVEDFEREIQSLT